MKLTKNQTANLVRIQTEDVAAYSYSEIRQHQAWMTKAECAAAGFSAMHANSVQWLILNKLAIAVPSVVTLAGEGNYVVNVLRLTDAGRAAIA